jgi:hypothetical protein
MDLLRKTQSNRAGMKPDSRLNGGVTRTEHPETNSEFGGAVMEVSSSEAARVLGRAGGRVGGRVKSPAKAAAARANGKRGGRPKVSNAQIEQFAAKILTEWREIKNG